MDEAEAIDDVTSRLRIDESKKDRLISRESTRLEYKESFNWGAKEQYVRTLAAFANTQGGHIVFGVKDSPRILVGLRNRNFQRFDPVRLSEFMGNTLAPVPLWAMCEVNIEGVKLGVLSVKAADSKPIIVKRNTEILKEGEIYYRYRARTERIKFSELDQILRAREEIEKQRWMQLFRQVGRIGVENLGLLDLHKGEISGSAGKLLIDASLLEQIKFIQEGQFTESLREGVPTLRLIGDVKPVESILKESVRRVPTPIVLSEKELMVGFLRLMRPDDPRTYLVQASRENSAYMPMYYFAKLAKFEPDDLVRLISDEGRHRLVKKRLRARVEGLRVTPSGSLSRGLASDQRMQILNALVVGNIEALMNADRRRLFEAVTHFNPQAPPTEVLEFLADVISMDFSEYSSNLKSQVRKAVAHLDEVLYN